MAPVTSLDSAFREAIRGMILEELRGALVALGVDGPAIRGEGTSLVALDAQLERQQLMKAARSPMRHAPNDRVGTKVLFSFRAAAQRLGIDRARIPELVKARVLRAVPGLDCKPRIPASEITRIELEGFRRVFGASNRPKIALHGSDVAAQIRALKL